MSNPKNLRVLIIEDDEIQSIALKDQLDSFLNSKNISNDITVVDSEDSAGRILNKNRFDIAFFDLHLKKDLEGIFCRSEAKKTKVPNYTFSMRFITGVTEVKKK